MTILRLMVSRKWIITTILVIIGSLVCVRLGIWQLDRLNQRRAFNTHYRETSTLPMLEITITPTADLTAMEYRSVVVTGSYDFEHQVALRNQVHNNQFGYHLLTPLILSDGTGILIDRGWIPAENNPQAWRTYDQPGNVTIKGILRNGQDQLELSNVNQTFLPVWSQVDIKRISQQLPYQLLPAYVQPDPDASLKKPPYPYQPEIVVDEGPHFGYMITWFSFAALLFFGYPFYLRRQVKLEEK